MKIDFETAVGFVEQEYGDSTAVRTNRPYMEHVYCGRAILNSFDKGDESIEVLAFVLHPLFQAAKDLIRNHEILEQLPVPTLEAVLEYRYWANKYDSKTELAVSDLAFVPYLATSCVMHMLVADKMHNRWQYECYRDKFPEEDQLRLDKYFKWWFRCLVISDFSYESRKQIMQKACSLADGHST